MSSCPIRLDLLFFATAFSKQWLKNSPRVTAIEWAIAGVDWNIAKTTAFYLSPFHRTCPATRGGLIRKLISFRLMVAIFLQLKIDLLSHNVFPFSCRLRYFGALLLMISSIRCWFYHHRAGQFILIHLLTSTALVSGFHQVTVKESVFRRFAWGCSSTLWKGVSPFLDFLSYRLIV